MLANALNEPREPLRCTLGASRLSALPLSFIWPCASRRVTRRCFALDAAPFIAAIVFHELGRRCSMSTAQLARRSSPLRRSVAAVGHTSLAAAKIQTQPGCSAERMKRSQRLFYSRTH